MSKILVIVYSYTGTCRRVGQLLCGQQQGWRMAEIVETRPRRGAMGTLRCVLDSIFRRHPAIHYDGPAPDDFDALVVVSPIWAQRLAGPMRSFLASRRNRWPHVFVVSVMGGKGAPNALAEITELVGRVPVLSTAITQREVDDGSCAGPLEVFGTAVSNASSSQAVVRPVTLSPQAV